MHRRILRRKRVSKDAALALSALVLLGLLTSCAQDPNPSTRSAGQKPSATPSATASSSPSPSPSPAPSPFFFAVLGDFGTGTASQADVADRMCEWRRNNPFDLVITTGDNVYPDGRAARFRKTFFRPYRCLLNDGVRFRSTLGNHDVITDNGAPELSEEAFGLNGRNYVLRTEGVRFLMVDSNAMRKRWLRRKLDPEAGDRWTVVVFHHPIFSAGAHGSTPGFRPALPRIFRNHGVDLVLNGHDHIFSSSKSLKKIRYIVTGGGGASLYNCSETWFTARCAARHHFLYIRAGAERLIIKAVPPQGPPFATVRTRGRD